MAGDGDRLAEVLEDLDAEQTELDAIVAPLSDADWQRPTPAAGWSVHDQIWHLARFDDTAATAIRDPEALDADRERVRRDPRALEQEAVDEGRRLDAPEVLRRWREGRARFREATAAAPRGRVDWFGQEMSVTSLGTARLMETWAHGLDVRDALGHPPAVADRLRHVAFLACRALPFSFAVRGREVPEEPVRVELALPSGATFAFGPEDAANRVTGDALDFCMVVTQRRHLDDVALEARGPVARAWLPLAQAYAGPPGPGREPGAATQQRAPRSEGR